MVKGVCNFHTPGERTSQTLNHWNMVYEQETPHRTDLAGFKPGPSCCEATVLTGSPPSFRTFESESVSFAKTCRLVWDWKRDCSKSTNCTIISGRNPHLRSENVYHFNNYNTTMKQFFFPADHNRSAKQAVCLLWWWFVRKPGYLSLTLEVSEVVFFFFCSRMHLLRQLKQHRVIITSVTL